MQSGGTIAPELDLDRLEAIAAPMLRSRYVGAGEPLFVSMNRRFEIGARGERPRLRACPGADLAPSRPGSEIGVALGRGHSGDGAAEPGLAAERFPVEKRRRPRLSLKFASLGALYVRVEDDAARVHALAQDHPRVGQPVAVDGGERHRFRVVDLRRLCFLETKLKQRERIRGLGKVGRAQIVQNTNAPKKKRKVNADNIATRG